jgi:hypothetical protein
MPIDGLSRIFVTAHVGHNTLNGLAQNNHCFLARSSNHV